MSVSKRGWRLKSVFLMPFLAGTLLSPPSTAKSPGSEKPSIEEYATVEAVVDGEPVYSFNNLCYIYGISPDLLPKARMQKDNTHPAIKIRPKKSWEIEHNLVGFTHEMTVKSPWTDSQPFLPIHLIDEDPNTAWCSWGCHVPDGRPEWIRIDLPMEREVSSVALVCSPNHPAMRVNYAQNKNYGRSLPKELEILLSRDAWHWETVYQTGNYTGDSEGVNEISFEPRAAKQIWIRANNFLETVSFAGHVFSLGEIEVRDAEGTNLASLARGAGVIASSHTGSSHDNDWFTQKSLWGPLLYDLGAKWVRVGPHNGSFTWNYVELEKGKLVVDPMADESINECNRNGVNVIMNLDLTMGNHRYKDEPRKLDWRETRMREVNNNYEDQPGIAFQNEEMWRGFIRYCDAMARHFKGRVQYYEFGNEWNVCFPPERYMEAFEEMYEVVKKADPDAKIMLGQTAGGKLFDDLLSCLGESWETGVRNGRLPLLHNTILMADHEKIDDPTLTLKSKNLGHINEGQFGFILRYKDTEDYLTALCRRSTDTIYFSDPRSDHLGNKFDQWIANTTTPDLGGEVELEMKIEGSKVILTVSDGEHVYSAEHTFEGEIFTGPFGIFYHSTRPIQHGGGESFDAFKIADAEGNTILHEEFDGGQGESPASLHYVYGRENPVKPGWGAKIDAVGWHSEGHDPEYVEQVKEIKKRLGELGFNGFYSAGEVGPSRGSLYPPGPEGGHQSEMQYAKIQIKKILTNNGMGIQAGICHPHFTGFHHDQPLTRITWPSQTQAVLNGGAGYYVWRTYSTIMDGFYPGDFDYAFGNPDKIMSFAFENEEANRLMVGGWYVDKIVDGIAEIENDLTLPGLVAEKAWVIDIFNGTEQELDMTPSGKGTLVKGLLIKDYPTFIRIQI